MIVLMIIAAFVVIYLVAFVVRRRNKKKPEESYRSPRSYIAGVPNTSERSSRQSYSGSSTYNSPSRLAKEESKPDDISASAHLILLDSVENTPNYEEVHHQYHQAPAPHADIGHSDHSSSHDSGGHDFGGGDHGDGFDGGGGGVD